MRQLVHVISDLHLGGAPATATEPGFQMCPPSTHQLLSDFINTLPASTPEQESQLVIAGDIVDFLAEAPFQAFTSDPALACEKLQRIFDSTAVVWDALNRFACERAGVLTLMLGNHDIELSLPAVRDMLYGRVKGAHVRFIYDNEAFTLGPLIIEHGNRFDAWNAIPHGALRRIRSQQSRQAEVTPDFPPPPGSRMVIDVLNPLKRQYPFIDLLKPETAAALPVAAALGALGLQDAWNAYKQFRSKQTVDFDEESGEPVSQGYVAAAAHPDQELWIAAQAIARGSDGQHISAVTDLLARGATVISERIRLARTDALYAAFRKLAVMRRMHSEAFDVAVEAETYLKPARRAASGQFRVIVYGHTHLPKRVQLQDAVYLNSGTWADVMCVPEGIWHEDEAAGRAIFRAFAGEMGAGSLDKWRRSVPTYARIVISEANSPVASLHFANDHTNVTTGELMRRLQGSVAP